MKVPLRLEPPFDQPIFALALRAAFVKATPRALSLPSALSPSACKLLRQLARPRLWNFYIADRGRYQLVELRHELRDQCAELLEGLRAFAEAISGQPLPDADARITWFSRGDYSLRLDDARARQSEHPGPGPRPTTLELSLDLSPAPREGAATIYTEGPFSHFPVAQLPGQLTLIERGPASVRCDRYRNVFAARAFILLRASFPLATVPVPIF